MTAQEKWERLTNPKTVADYGLSMTETELLEFEEGRKMVEALRGVTDERMDLVAKMIAKNVGHAVERVSYGVLKAYPLGSNAIVRGGSDGQ